MHKTLIWLRFYGWYQSLPMIKCYEDQRKNRMCHTSARFHAMILITWILTNPGRSKNFQNRRKFGWKVRIQHRPDKQDS